MPRGQVDIALVHYPVYNKNRETIGSAVTNLDLHDLARTARTYGVGTVYIVTPYAEQQELVREIVGHWQDGYGASYNQDRKEALAVVKICDDLPQLLELVGNSPGPQLIATTANPQGEVLGFAQARALLDQGEQLLLLFGTAWGLADEVFEQVDQVLAPIAGNTDYNHLSVRSAVAIIVDRLLGQR